MGSMIVIADLLSQSSLLRQLLLLKSAAMRGLLWSIWDTKMWVFYGACGYWSKVRLWLWRLFVTHSKKKKGCVHLLRCWLSFLLLFFSFGCSYVDIDLGWGWCLWWLEDLVGFSSLGGFGSLFFFPTNLEFWRFIQLCSYLVGYE